MTSNSSVVTTIWHWPRLLKSGITPIAQLCTHFDLVKSNGKYDGDGKRDEDGDGDGNNDIVNSQLET